MYSVAIADDEVCIREGLRDLVEWHKLGFSLVALLRTVMNQYRYLSVNHRTFSSPISV